MIGVRDEYQLKFGRQVLTIWSGRFADQWEGEAFELPRHNGYMVTTYRGRKIRVTCESPRTETNYLEVDTTIGAAIEATKKETRL